MQEITLVHESANCKLRVEIDPDAKLGIRDKSKLKVTFNKLVALLDCKLGVGDGNVPLHISSENDTFDFTANIVGPLTTNELTSLLSAVRTMLYITHKYRREELYVRG